MYFFEAALPAYRPKSMPLGGFCKAISKQNRWLRIFLRRLQGTDIYLNQIRDADPPDDVL